MFAFCHLTCMIYCVALQDIRLLWRYMTEVGHLVGAETNKSAETMKEVIKFEAELAKVMHCFYSLLVVGSKHSVEFWVFKKKFRRPR